MKRMSAILFALFLPFFSIVQIDAQDDLERLKAEAIDTYAQIAYASYADSLELAEDLNAALTAFVDSPSEETLDAARTAWLAAQEPYGQTEAYRFYGGPIDDEDGPEGLLNAWPLDEAYIDYVDGAADAGIINDPDTYPEITRELVVSLNEEGGEENISTGYHAIEFLLWGQDLSADSAGTRDFTDYTTASNAERRATYLTVLGDLLVENLTELVDAWAPDVEDNYRAAFTAQPADDTLRDIFTGIAVLAKAELGGERMFTAYDNQDQEDEHSCFSDNTHRDIVTNFMGINNVYNGTYTRLDGTVIEGTGLSAVVNAVAADTDARILDLLATASEQTDTIYVPFDQAIVLADERPVVFETVITLFDLGDAFAAAAAELDLTISTELPE